MFINVVKYRIEGDSLFYAENLAYTLPTLERKIL
jgi:hypothetical protein